MKTLSVFSSHTMMVLVFLVVACYCPSSSQGTKRFAMEGTTELGGSISFLSVTPVSNGRSGDSYTIFSFSPFIGYFITDGFELGVDPFAITTTSGSITVVNVLVAPSYNFKTDGIAYPFVEGLLGYSSISDGSTSNGVSWGLRGGVKLAVVDQGLLNLGLQYLQITTNPSGASNRYGSNQFSFTAGFTIWQ